jgi:hypothetical protein
MAVQAWAYRSVTFAGQQDLVTEASTDLTVFACEVAIPKRGRESADLDYAVGQVGAGKGPVTGVRQGSEFSIKFPLTMLKTGYNPSTSTPGDTNQTTSPAAVLLANALGSRNASIASAANLRNGVGLYNETYDETAVVASSTTSLVKLDAGLGAGILPGSLLAIGVPTTNALRQLGWVASVSTDDVNLAEAWSQAALSGDNILPSATATLNGNEQIPLTFFIKGRSASFNDVAIGAVCKSIKLTMEAGMVPMVEMTYSAYGDFYRKTTGGAVTLPDDDYKVLKPLAGAFGGRLTVDTAVTCGFEKLTLDIAIDVQPVKCFSGLQGVSAVNTVNRQLSVSFSVPRDSADTITDGNDPWQTRFANETYFTLLGYVGSAAGNIFAFAMATLLITEEPQMEDIGGRVYIAVKAKPGVVDFFGDGTSSDTAPQNSVLMLAWA